MKEGRAPLAGERPIRWAFTTVPRESSMPSPDYVGDASDLRKRILTNHIRGNVEGSVLRSHVAVTLGFEISRTKRASGSTRSLIDSDDPKRDEATVSDYIRSGKWRVVPCSTYSDAQELQWFLIDRLSPRLNKRRKPWDESRAGDFERLWALARSARSYSYEDLRHLPSRPGVYAFYGDHQ